MLERKPLMIDDSTFTYAAPNEEALLQAVGDLAAALQPGDFVSLTGDLGSGKTTFARALIRQLAGDQQFEVPSPTFTLVQTYTLPRLAIVHADFYRVTDASELTELGFDDQSAESVTLLEWPERAPQVLPEDRWEVSFALLPEQGAEFREVRISGLGKHEARGRRLAARRRFLNDSGYTRAIAEHLAGDASTRFYERVRLGERSLILMDAPRRPDGPPVRNGKPYSAIAHLAEDVKPFVAIAQALRGLGFSTPRILAADLEEGLVVLENLGSDLVVTGNLPAPIPARY
jgi:hypothetical protein